MAPEPARLFVRLSTLFVLLVLAVPAHALRVIDWNVLNYPGNTGPARDPLYRTVLSPISPDILVTEEQNSQTGATEFLGSLNTMEPGLWSGAPFVVGGDTQAAMFYKASKVNFLGQRQFWPNSASHLRQINVYRFAPVGYTNVWFEIWTAHLKASTGSTNVAQRLAEATGIRDSLNLMPAGSLVLVVGDMNFYTGLEGGMQKFVESETNNSGRLYDPYGFENVTWQDNVTLESVWTQSPCKTGDTGCASGAATGGLDDRFDLILPTYAWNDGAGMEIVPGTMIAVGNDGQHHNNSIQDPPTIPEGATYATALHSSSDHLPVRVDLQLPAILTAASAPIAFGTVITGATATQTLAVSNGVGNPGETLTYTYTAPAGFGAPIGQQSLVAGAGSNDPLSMDTSTPGALGGSLQIASNAPDNPNRSITLSGTVLRHAVPSLDSLTATGSGAIDFGTHDSTGFAPADVRVFNQGYDALQAQLMVNAATVTGADGRFSIVNGSVPVTLADVGKTFTVAFDPAGATPDSEYDATLTFGSADQALPGGAAQGDLAVTLKATKQGGGNVAVDGAKPTRTLLYAPAPNPLQGASTLRFDLARTGDVALEIFDVSGRRTTTLTHRTLEPGRYSLRWDGLTDGGAPAHAGLYFVRLTAPGADRQSVRLAIVK